MSSQSTNLRADETRFVGRARDLERLETAIDAGERLVSVMGPAGMGKTRLLRRFGALQEAGRFPGGVWFCELAEARSLEELCAAVAASCGIDLAPRGTEAELAQAIGDGLAGLGQTLLLLDNFEQLASWSAASLAVWHAAAPQAVFLVSTRDRLQLPAEVVHELEPLELAAATELLDARAASVRRGVVIPPDRAAAIVERLDRIPLAIELAAARMGVLTPAQVLQRLESRFDLLRAKHRNRTARQQTLWGAIDWSWQLLSDDERKALAALSVFRGGFTLEAAEELLAPWTDDVLETIQNLRDRSLLYVYTPDATPDVARLGMYETIRAFAAQQLKDLGGERAEARDAHLRWTLRAGSELSALVHGHSGDDARRALALERDNLLAAVERALERDEAATAGQLVLVLDPVLATRGPFRRHRELLDRVLDRPQDAATQGWLLLARGQLQRRSGELIEARRDLEAALACAMDAGERHAELEGDILSHLGIATHEAGDLETARSHYERALDIFRELGDPRREGRALGSLAILHNERGRFEDAQTHYEWALRLLRRAGDTRSQAIFLCNLGDLHHENGRLAEAQRHYERALGLLEMVGDQRVFGVVVGNLGAVLQERGELDAALEKRREAVRLLSAAGDRRLAAVFEGYSGEVLHEQGKLDEATEAYDAALMVLEDLGDRRYAALFSSDRAAAAVERGAVGAAEPDWERAEELLGDLDDRLLQVALETHRGGLLALADGDPVAARAARDAAQEQAASSDAVRFALRRLEAAMEAAGVAPSGAEGAAPTLRVAADGRGFEAPGGEPVDLSRRRALRLIVGTLGAQREEHPGVGLSLDDLLEAGWPGEKVQPEAGANRVYVALATLRKMGLREVLLSRDDGYLLDPTVEFERYSD